MCYYKGSDKEISIKGINKNNKESYIVVDILDNKVYKHKEVIYSNVENVLNKYSSQVDVSACIVGEYTKGYKTTNMMIFYKNII